MSYFGSVLTCKSISLEVFSVFPRSNSDVLSARPNLTAGAVGTQRQEVTMANIGREIEQRAKTATVCRVREVKCNVDK